MHPTSLCLDGIAYANAYFGQGTGDIALQNVACSGTENTLLACSSNTIFDTSCSHSEDAGVKCEGIQIQYIYFGMTIGPHLVIVWQFSEGVYLVIFIVNQININFIIFCISEFCDHYNLNTIKMEVTANIT